jgi:hypothetical protein
MKVSTHSKLLALPAGKDPDKEAFAPGCVSEWIGGSSPPMTVESTDDVQSAVDHPGRSFSAASTAARRGMGSTAP